MAQRRGRPAQQRGVATRERLVVAALEAFAGTVTPALRHGRVAERAGVALAALPYHFETREALWRAAADRTFGRAVFSFSAPATCSCTMGRPAVSGSLRRIQFGRFSPPKYFALGESEVQHGNLSQ